MLSAKALSQESPVLPTALAFAKQPNFEQIGSAFFFRPDRFRMIHLTRPDLPSYDAYIDAETGMRTTVNLDDTLLDKATALTGVTERGVLMKEALKALIERESAKRLALLGGTEPDLKLTPRRRAE